MPRGRVPVERQKLSLDLAESMRELIVARGYACGDRLPSIAEMARRYGVSHPTLREALRVLETLGYVEIRHGSGVYVGSIRNSLLIANPVFRGPITGKVLMDLVEARIPIEAQTASLAAVHATEPQLRQMRQQLALAEADLDDEALLSEVNFAFHDHLALASGNQILHQLLEVLGNVIREEQRVILDDIATRRQFHREHVGILEAVDERMPDLAARRMRVHLEGMRELVARWGREPGVAMR